MMYGGVNSLNIFSCNIRSLNKNFDNLLILLSTIEVDFDLIILSECWLKDNEPHQKINGYDMIYSFNNRKQNDGVAIFIKHSLSYTANEPRLMDANCLQVIINNSIAILGIYRSPSCRNIKPFLTSLTELLDKYKTHDYRYILGGDLNINILDNTDSQVNDYICHLAEYSLEPAINKVTRFNSCLDHIFTSMHRNVIGIVCDSQLTDHYPTILSASLNSCLNNSIPLKTATFLDNESLSAAIDNIEWNDLYTMKDVNLATDFFVQTLEALIIKNTKTKLISHKKKKLKPWITDGLLISIRKRDKLHLQLKSDPGNSLLQHEYIRYRNLLKILINKTKNKYYRDKLKEVSSDARKTWQIVKDITYGKRTNSSDIRQLTIHGHTQTVNDLNRRTIANHMNDYFTGIGETLANRILTDNKVSETDLSDLLNNTNTTLTPLLTLSIATDDEISKIITNMKSTKSRGTDCITSQIIKANMRVLVTPICHLVNLSLTTGCFPSHLKQAVIFPIFKGGARDDCGCYRPISLLNSLSKIFEKVVKQRLIAFLEDNNLLTPMQFGFRSARGTQDAIAAVTEKIVKALDDGDKCVTVFLDLAKAFDTVSHRLLLKKLYLIGIHDTSLRWFDDYLSGRSQATKLGDTSSSKSGINFGVPQGSVLGPILFLIYINELSSIPLCKGEAILFADDTALVFRERSWQGVFENCQMGLKRVKDWLDCNLLSLNVEKTKYMTFSKTSKGMHRTAGLSLIVHTCKDSPSALCACSTLDMVSTIKYLGLTLDNRLSWSYHIYNTAAKIRKLMHPFKLLRNVLSKPVLKIVYYALAHSIISYGILGWGGAAHIASRSAY